MMGLMIDIIGNNFQLVTDFFYESKRWELIINRRKPVIKDKIGYLIDKCVQSLLDNCYTETAEWFILDFQVGYRRMKWVNYITYISKHSPYQRNIDGSLSICIKSDSESQDHKGNHLDHIISLSYISFLRFIKFDATIRTRIMARWFHLPKISKTINSTA